jgi:branched-chain amino acid transport system substrate-binding protein
MSCSSMRSFSSFLVLLLYQVLFAQVSFSDTPPVRIGALMALTGQYSMQVGAFREGLELAADQLNSEGGINGARVELLVEDTGNIPVSALTSARKMIRSPGLVAAITSSYPELATGAAEFQRNRIPVVHLWDASPEIEEMGDYLFGIGPWIPSAGEVSAKFAARRLKAVTAVTFHVNDPWSQLVTDYFEREFVANGGRVLRSFSFNPQDQDLRAVCSKVRALKPDVIYSPVGDNIVPFYSQLRHQNPSVPVISSDVISEEHVKQAPAVFDGIYQSQMGDPKGDKMVELSDLYERKFNKPLTLPWFVATGYDSVKLIAVCSKKVGAMPVAVRDCIANTKGLTGVSQTFSFNEGGSSPQQETVFQLRQGRFTLAE